MLIDIKARSVLSPLTPSPSPSTPQRTEWAIHIHVVDTQARRDVSLKDPLSLGQRQVCRWYLEKYLKKSPYSAELEKQARGLLEEYPKRLWRELCFTEMLSLSGSMHQERLRPCTIRISESDYVSKDSENTIHQLFWETLEYMDENAASGWKFTVERQLFPIGSPEFPLREHIGSTRRINILLVIGRDMSRNSEKYDDICPFLAFRAVNQVRNSLNASGNPLKVHLEVARPGTFAAFEGHLRRRKEKHGPGFFHIVHFDLHGMVKIWGRKNEKKNPNQIGKKAGILYFAHEDSNEKRPVLALKVAAVLRQHDVPLVIMNACDSATAYSGDDANIAGVFQRQGRVRNVLAMSFKISSTAADLFLTKFYMSFLVGGLTLAASAREARHSLRLNILRPARFGVQRELLDAFVPVLYGPGDTRAFAEDEPLEETCLNHDLPYRSASQTIQVPLNIMGRDFDILRLEKVLCENSIVFLHGPTGVGKTSLLQYASILWQHTHWTDVVVTIDFVAEKISSAADFANTVLNQLLRACNPAERSGLWTIPSLQTQSHNLDAVKDIIRELISTCKVIFIVDGLDMLSSPSRVLPIAGTSCFDPGWRDIFQVIESIIVPATLCSAERRSWLIVAARHPNVEWARGALGPEGKAQGFELQGLELADSMELSQKILSDAGEDISKWEYVDFDWLASCIGLLQGIPLALKEVLPFQQALSIPWREFYGRLHGDSLPSLRDLALGDLESHPILKELVLISSTFPRDLLVLLSLFSSYWGESASLNCLERLFKAAYRQETDETQQTKLEPEKFTAWAGGILSFAMHRGYIRPGSSPHTICVQVHPLFTIYARTLAPQVNPHSKHPWMRELILKSIQLKQFEKEEFADETNEVFIRSTKFDDATNLLTSIKLCLELSHKIQPCEWPTHALYVFLSDHPLPINLADSFLDFLKLCIEPLNISGEQWPTPGFCVLMISHVYENPQLSSWLHERCQEVTHFLIELMRSLDKYHEKDPDLETMVMKATLIVMLFKYQSVFDPNISTIDSKSMVGDIIDDLLIYRQTKALAEESLRQDIDMIICAIEEIRTPKTSPLPEENVDMPRLKTFLGTIPDKYTEAELRESSRFSLFDLELDVPKKDDAVFLFLQNLEDAKDTGDWLNSLHCHKLLLEGAMKKFSYDEAGEHISAIRHLCKTADREMPLSGLDNLNDEVDKQRAQFQFLLSTFPSSEGKRLRGGTQAQKKAISAMADTNPLLSFYANKRLDETTAEQGSDGYLPGLSREEMLRHLRKHRKTLTDAHSAAAMKAQVEDFMESWMLARHAMTHNEYSTCLKHLDHVEKMLEESEFLHDSFDVVEQIKTIRQKCQEMQSVVNQLYAHTDAVLNGDYDRARSMLDEISNPDLRSDEKFTAMYDAVDLEYLARELMNARKLQDFSEVRKLHSKYMSIWLQMRKRLPWVEEIEGAIMENLEWLLEKSLDEMQWQVGIELCDEGLEYSAALDEETSFQREQLRIMREEFQIRLAMEALNTAEAATDLNACLESFNSLEGLLSNRRQINVLRHGGNIMLSDKQMEFLRLCYEDGCIPCARWVRRRESQPCMLAKQKNQQHQKVQHYRSSFYAPFGCPHHSRCVEGYCFLGY